MPWQELTSELEKEFRRKITSIRGKWQRIGGCMKCSVKNCPKAVAGRSQDGTGYCSEHLKEHDTQAYNQRRDKKSCGVEGCLKQAQCGTGYCAEHLKEHNPEAYNKYRDEKSCGVEDCNTQAVCGGYCSTHARELVPDLHRE